MSSIDERNKLNDLTGKEWIQATRSFWFSEKCKDDKFALGHPAPFLIKDIEKLICFFTKKSQLVLDPFGGFGTTLIAAHNTNRKGAAIELNENYCAKMEERLAMLNVKAGQKIIHGDSLEKIKSIRGKIDYCVTSPPYHNILKNKGEGIRKKNGKYRNGARDGVDYYSDDTRDLGNQEKYTDFLNLIGQIFKEVFEKLNDDKYCSIIISDFTVDKKEMNVQGDIVRILENIGFKFMGTIILLQNNKPLYPFGYPYSYVINHHHQNIINFKKPRPTKP